MEAQIYNLTFIMFYTHFPLTGHLVVKYFCDSLVNLSSQAHTLINVLCIYTYIFILNMTNIINMYTVYIICNIIY